MMMYAGIIILVIGFFIVGIEIGQDSDDPYGVATIVIGITLIALSGLFDTWDEEDAEKYRDNYCTKAVEKGQFTSEEECKYVLDKY